MSTAAAPNAADLQLVAWLAEQYGAHLPDALVLTEGRRVAIEVELSVKSRRRLEQILDELVAGHDAVLYFCTPATERAIGPLAQSGRWPSLGVRPLPGPRPRWMR